MKLALVVWHDAWDGDAYLESDHGPLVVRSVGFVVKHDAAGISLVACVDNEGALKRPLFVPHGCIQSVKFLKDR